MNKFIVLAMSLALLSGCASLKKVTGQTNDTVLPGAREEIIAPSQQVATDPAITGQPVAPPAAMPKDAMSKKQMAAIPAMPKSPVRSTDPSLALPKSTSSDTITDCDPKVDLCPEAQAPDPLPPPSKPAPLKMAAASKTAAMSSTDATTKMAKSAKKKKAKKKAATAAAPGAPAVPAAPDVPLPPAPKGQ